MRTLRVVPSEPRGELACPADQSIETASARAKERWQFRLAGAGLAGLALGFSAGAVVGEVSSATHFHTSGACIALEMAAAHGALDDVTYRRVVRSLSSIQNPFQDRFPESSSRLSEQCAAIRMYATGASADQIRHFMRSQQKN